MIIILLYTDSNEPVSKALLSRGSDLGGTFVPLSLSQLVSEVTFGARWRWHNLMIDPSRSALINRLVSFDCLLPAARWKSSYFEKQQVWSWLRVALQRFAYCTAIPSSFSLMGCMGMLSDEHQHANGLVSGIGVANLTEPLEASSVEIAQVYRTIAAGRSSSDPRPLFKRTSSSPVFVARLGNRIAFAGAPLTSDCKERIRQFVVRSSQLTHRRIFECCFMVKGEDLEYRSIRFHTGSAVTVSTFHRSACCWAEKRCLWRLNMELVKKFAFAPAVENPSGNFRFRFQLDFDSEVVWPDVDFDTSHPSTRYLDEAHAAVLQLHFEASAALVEFSAPAHAFINEHLGTVIMRRKHPFLEASSSSNRHHLGTCLLTNIEVAEPSPYVTIEYLVHEAIHQCLYTEEVNHGAFVNVASTERIRSPWTRNSIPAHSLIHACFVW